MATMQLTIPRSEWARGQYSLYLWNGTCGCFFGHYFRACGVPLINMLGKIEPEDIFSYRGWEALSKDPRILKAFVATDPIDEEESFCPARMREEVGDIIDVNDSDAITDSAREFQIKVLALYHLDCEVTFA